MIRVAVNAIVGLVMTITSIVCLTHLPRVRREFISSLGFSEQALVNHVEHFALMFTSAWIILGIGLAVGIYFLIHALTVYNTVLMMNDQFAKLRG